jgi:uncharacterized protein (TIGR00255 family)
MTGYGRGEQEGLGKRILFEIKTVNHRFLDIYIRMPKTLSLYEDKFKKIIQKGISRGRVEVYVTIEQLEGTSNKSVIIDKGLMITYYKELEKLKKELSIDSSINMSVLTSIPDAVTVTEAQIDQEEFYSLLERALCLAMVSLTSLRGSEGKRLMDSMTISLDKIKDSIDKISQRAPLVIEEYRKKLQDRIKDLIPTDKLDFDRIHTEVVLYADRSEINEELVRLNSHLVSFFDIMNEEDPVGRKLDFMLQEMNREVNTIGSKSSDSMISNYVIHMKSEIEKIREQVQNIE